MKSFGEAPAPMKQRVVEKIRQSALPGFPRNLICSEHAKIDTNDRCCRKSLFEPWSSNFKGRWRVYKKVSWGELSSDGELTDDLRNGALGTIEWRLPLVLPFREKLARSVFVLFL